MYQIPTQSVVLGSKWKQHEKKKGGKEIGGSPDEDQIWFNLAVIVKFFFFPLSSLSFHFIFLKFREQTIYNCGSACVDWKIMRTVITYSVSQIKLYFIRSFYELGVCNRICPQNKRYHVNSMWFHHVDYLFLRLHILDLEVWYDPKIYIRIWNILKTFLFIN